MKFLVLIAHSLFPPGGAYSIIPEESILSYNVSFISLGCAKNQVNCEQMIWKTYEAGYEVALGAEG